MGKKKHNPLHKETGSASLKRYHFHNEVEDDIDVPDGDI